MKRTYWRNIALALVILAVGLKGRAERGDTLVNPYTALMHLLSGIDRDSLYTAQLAGQYDRVDTSGNHSYDSLKMIYTIQGEKYQSITDTVELMQNDLYNVTVNNIDSFIIIAPPRKVYPILLQGDILDPVFQQHYLDSIYVEDDSLIRNIKMTFKYSSPWYSYLYAYDAGVGFIAVIYKMRHSIPLTPSGSYTIPNPTTDYTQLFLNINISTPLSPPVNPFDTGKYFKRSGSDFIPVAPYANYQIINQLFNQ